MIDGKIMVHNTYHRNFGSGIWHHLGKTQYTYTADGLKEKEIRQENHLGELKNTEKFEYLYDMQSRLKERLYYKWIDTLGFVKSKKVEYLYNDQPRYQVEIYTFWDDLNMTWKTSGKRIDYFAEDNSLDSIYDRGVNYAGEEYRRLTTVQFNSDKTILDYTNKEWDNDTNSWFTKTFHRWYFEDYDWQPKEKEPFDVSVFPNPASDYIYFGKGPDPDVEAYIYSASGMLLVSQKLSQTNRIYVGDWPIGVYYYVLVYDHRTSSGSILKL
ncbi:MAG TPA: T9SS type A sorting domain-containing protein [Bacteroidetes bacterium]|nr:T9SS type A sorting domain-containing protein [Bacteroidota bacterium]